MKDSREEQLECIFRLYIAYISYCLNQGVSTNDILDIKVFLLYIAGVLKEKELTLAKCSDMI